MIEPNLPDNESERLAALKSYQILDTAAEIDFDDFTHLASHICDTPIALITLLDESRQWFKSKIGLVADSTPRTISFCGHAILQNEVFEIHNALEDPRFFDNPLVTSKPNIRFYAGVPIVTREGYKLGTLCVIDTVPKKLNSAQREALLRLSRQVMLQITTRYKSIQIKELNNQLVEKVSFIQKVTDNIPVLISYLDQDLKCQFANNAYREIYLLPRESIIGQSLNEIASPEVYEYIYPYAIKALAGETQQFEITAHIWNCDRHGAVHYIPDLNSHGDVVGFYSLISDITDSKLSQEKQKLISKVVEKASDAILITDANHYILTVNQGFARLTEYTPQEVIGNLPSFLDYCKDGRNIYKEILHGLETQHYWSGDVYIKRKNGDLINTSLSVSCIYNDHGEVINHVAIYQDRTIKDIHKNELERLSGMLNRTGEMAKVWGWEYDLIQKKLDYSPQLYKILEINPYLNIDYESAIKLVSPEYEGKILALANACIKDGTPWDIELPITTAQGNKIWVHSTGERVCENGSPIKLVGSTQDITQRKLVAIQLKEEEIAHKAALIREVHHRIKNHLMGVSNLLFNYGYTNPQISEPIAAAISKIQSVAVIHGLQGKDHKTRVELVELISSISESIGNLWESAIFISQPKIYSPLFIAESECVPIALILNELISNAIKHRRAASKIMIQVEQLASSEKVQIVISNLLKSKSNNVPDFGKGNGLSLVDSLMPKYGTSLILKQNSDTMIVHFIIDSPILELD